MFLFSNYIICRSYSMEFSKKDLKAAVEAITGYNAVSLSASLKGSKLILKGTLETGKGYSSHSRTVEGNYKVSSSGELMTSAGKYYNAMRGCYMTNWKYTGIKLPSVFRGKVFEIEYNFEQDLD